MSEPLVPLAIPTLGGNTEAYLLECIRTNYVSSVGPFVGRFEEAFAAAVGSRFAVACASGTAAIHLAMRLVGIEPGDDVIVPSLTFVASANPVLYERGTPVLVDSEDMTLNADPGVIIEELDRRRRSGVRMPKAIEVVHLLGHPAAIDEVMAAADRHGIPVIEDASEALGATYTAGPFQGRQVGSIGRIGCFSFNGNKLVTTGGGGMLTTDDPELANRARSLSTQARRPGRAYWHDEVGYNYRLTNLAAAVGVAQLEQLDELLAGRRRNAAAYDEGIAIRAWLQPAARASWAAPTFWLYTTRRRDPAPARDAFIDALATAGIEARPIWTPLHRMPIFAGAPKLGGAVADRIFEDAFSLPSTSSLSERERARVLAALDQVEGGAMPPAAPAPLKGDARPVRRL